MKVFKFGGASVRNAEGIKNVLSILKLFPKENIAVVVSAMGKTTNALEDVTRAYVKNDDKKKELLDAIRHYHYEEIKLLFPNQPEHPVYADVDDIFNSISKRFNITASSNYDLVYDQIVSQGEVLSSKIVSHFLNDNGIENEWLDARNIIRTDSTFREARVDWEASQKLANQHLIPLYSGSIRRKIVLTQGFIGSTTINLSTTLGREGSDYTAAILAFLLDAKDVTIWKDVAGVMNADPRYFSDAVKLNKISFKEAIELSYYGASVIHPKTIKPLQNKGIPLYVKSFYHPEDNGTIIQSEEEHDDSIASFIIKRNQILLSIFPKDFSFIVEHNLKEIFEIFSKRSVRIHLMQNSALSFSVCFDLDSDKFNHLIKDLQENYKVRYNENCELLTIRHYNEELLQKMTANKEQLVLQKSRHTARVVLR